MHTYYSVFIRELQIHLQRKSEWFAVVLFYLIVISLFPIAIGPLPQNIIPYTPVIIWIAALLAMVLAQEGLLRTDFQLGTFEQMLLADTKFSRLILAKVLAHWIIFAVPIILLTPILALSLNLPLQTITIITLSLCFGTLILSFVGALGAALTVALARGGVLLAILILPLYIPVLSLGSSLGMLSVQGVVSNGHMALLIALSIVAAYCTPHAIAAAIKVSLE